MTKKVVPESVYEIEELIWKRYASRSLAVIPRSHALVFEADVLVVMRSLYTHEFEIKMSRADFMADRLKDKWVNRAAWATGAGVATVPDPWHPGETHNVRVFQPANYFWYVCPRDLIKPADIEPWMGLMYVRGNGLIVMQDAQRTHKEKLGTAQLLQITSSLSARMWKTRHILDTLYAVKDAVKAQLEITQSEKEIPV